MRYKVAPPPRSLDELEAARSAIPLVPDDEADCCRAIRQAIDCPTRERAREYLLFLHSLGLVERSDRGYYRTQDSLDSDALAAAFRQNVFAVAELLTALESGPKDIDAAFDALRETIPEWERNRHSDWETAWYERIGNLLEWALVFGLVARTDGQYHLR